MRQEKEKSFWPSKQAPKRKRAVATTRLAPRAPTLVPVVFDLLLEQSALQHTEKTLQIVMAHGGVCECVTQNGASSEEARVAVVCARRRTQVM
jgi:hypothetical protein